MPCEYFNVGRLGYCGASDNNYAPTLYEMERYCFTEFGKACERYVSYGVPSSTGKTVCKTDVLLQK